MEHYLSWTEEAHLTALVVDAARILAWQKTRDGSKGRNAPKPLPRPGVESDEQKSYGGEPVSMEDFDAWLAGDFVDVEFGG